MRTLLLTILFLSCTKTVLTVSEPIADVPVIVTEDKPIFQLGMPFGDGAVVEPVKSMPVWSPVVEKPAKHVLCTDRIVVLHDTTIVPAYIKSVHYDTVTVEKIVHSRGLAYLMLVVGFWIGVLTVLLIVWFPRKPKSNKSEVVKRDISESIKKLNEAPCKFICLIK